MPTRIGVPVIHGMGAQKPGFSAGLTKELISRLGSAAGRFVWKEVYWADVLEAPEDRLWKAMGAAKEPNGKSIRLDWVAIRHFVVHNFGDALAYHRDSGGSSAYVRVHKVISTTLAELESELDDGKSPIVVLAHSLGAHMMSNYIWDRQNWSGPDADSLTSIANLVGLVTFGCNIPLFSLDFDVATPIDLPGPGITRPRLKTASRWLNFLDRDDVLAWPLKPLYQTDRRKLSASKQATVNRIEDYEINVGGFTTSWNPAAHAGYWTDNDFTKPAAAYLKRILDALDA
jgi:hypothetical protein